MVTRTRFLRLQPFALALSLAGCLLAACDGSESSDDDLDPQSDAAQDESPASGNDSGSPSKSGDPGEADAAPGRDAGASGPAKPPPEADAAARGDDLDAALVPPMDASSALGDASSADASADPPAPADAASGPAEDASGIDAGPADAAADASAVDASGDAAANASGDASGDAAPDESDAAEPQCIPAGENCERGSCCEGAVCAPDPDTGYYLCGSPCDVRADRCDACGPYCGAKLNGTGRCTRAYVVAHDGTYLGLASSSPNTKESVCSRTDPYATGQRPESIYNEFGTYGRSLSSPLSAYNPNTASPPAIVCADTNAVIARVTKSKNLSFRPVDPDELCSWLRGQQL